MPDDRPDAPLLLVAHGSPDPRHRAAMAGLRDRVARRTAATVALGFLDHDRPTVAEAAATLPAEPSPIGVALLLARGYHARQDVPRELKAVAATDAGPIGLDGPVVDAVAQVVRASGVDPHDPTVAQLLVTAGSTQDQAREDYAALRRGVATATHGNVHVVTLAEGSAAVTSAVAELSARSGSVAVVPMLMAPGVLSDRLRVAIAMADRPDCLVTTHVGAAPAIVDAVLARALIVADVPRSARARAPAPR